MEINNNKSETAAMIANARTASPYSNTESGFFSVPRMGDESIDQSITFHAFHIVIVLHRDAVNGVRLGLLSDAHPGA